ncbi:AAA family ATPase [Oscillatoriales cyanobacterium USR001]|nr:AAA family ATPase [Oscillatoriales cyanobacterium USR001]
MNDLFKGFDQLLELAKTLEEKIQSGEMKADVQINTRPFSSIPRQGNIPRVVIPNRDIGTTHVRTQSNAPETTDSETKVTSPIEFSALQDVGGLNRIVKELKELVAIPLKRPELLAKFGIEPTKGVLLIGPPGTGKTLTARALANELGVNYIALAGPELMSKYYGETEQKLREVFEKAAKNAPCLIFIDEIDSIAPDRARVEGEVEKRLVAQLLSLMDGFAQTNGVILLAATNRPEHLDPALRRPGRFDREVYFPVPDCQGRLEILQILTRSQPLDETVNLSAIADLAVGFVGADLKAVCQKAAYSSLRRHVPELEAVIPDKMSITHSDFLQAIKDIKPAVLRSVEIESPQVSWEEIGGLEDIKQILRESVEGALLHPELYYQTKAIAPRGILLHGPPGTGKTLLAKAVASQGKANFIGVNGPELLSRWVGASEQAVRELFAKARQASPCVIFIDEIDTLAPARGSHVGDSGVSDRVVGQLLTELDGLHNSANILLICATNRPEIIDPALLRSGRLDLQLKVDLPNLERRLAILEIHNQDRPLNQVNLAHWASLTADWNGADLALLSNQAAVEAIRCYRAENLSDVSAIKITTTHFNTAYERLAEQRK